MKKIISFLLVVVMCIGVANVSTFAAESDDKPVIGIAWRADLDSEFYTNITKALELVNVDYVLLPQVKSADLKYDVNGKLKKGVGKTGALTKASGKLIRANTWYGSNAAEAAKDVDAVIFTGGEDISPSLYYKQVKWHGIEEERDYNAERDVSDYLLMTYCLDNDIPIMGFCRGMQLLGVVSGSEVIQDIPMFFEKLGKEYKYEHRNIKATPASYRDYASHYVKVAKNSILYDITGKKTITGCPSWHHQALKNVDNTRLKVTGTLNVNGIDMIEAIERTDKTCAVGLQFHPEAAVVKHVTNAVNADAFMSMDEALHFFEYLADVAEEYHKKNHISADSLTTEFTDVQYVVYLGTNDKDTNEPVFPKEECMSKAQEILLKHFGGYTIMEAHGGWIDGDKIYQEYTLVIYLSYTTEDEVYSVSDELIDTFNQSSVMIQTNPTRTQYYGG